MSEKAESGTVPRSLCKQRKKERRSKMWAAHIL